MPCPQMLKTPRARFLDVVHAILWKKFNTTFVSKLIQFNYEFNVWPPHPKATELQSSLQT